MKIAIIGAMQVEINALKNALTNIKTTKIHSFTFYEGEINGTEVVILLSGIGKVSASVSTTLLIEHFKPSLIINTGTAGGLGSSNVYDIVLATEVRHHDVDVTAFGYEIGQQAQMPPCYFPDKKWFEIAQKVTQKYQNRLRCGLVISGDAFISSPEKLAEIQQKFPTAIAVEMEAAAIAQTCYLLQTPFIMLRAISDKAGEGNTISYDKFVSEAGELSAKINIDIISTNKKGLL